MNAVFVSALWLAIAAESLWILFGGYLSPGKFPAVEYAVFIVAGFTVLALTSRRSRWVPVLARLFVGYKFLESVADRFGFLGGPGTKGVSWGDFAHFVVSTRQINSFLPATMAYPLAVTATIAETVFGAALILGFQVRLASRLSALLLLLFATAMTISLPSAYQFMYGVFVMAAGAAVISVSDASAFSLDSALGKRAAESSR